MYNDKDNNELSRYEYHYSYHPDYSEPIPTLQPVKPKKKGRAKKIIAGILAVVMLAGISFGAGWLTKGYLSGGGTGASPDGGETDIYLSERDVPEVKTVNVDGKNELTYREIYKANVDSSVSINVTTVSNAYNYFGRQVEVPSSGSGFIISEDGYIVTNHHVVDGATTVKVTLNNGTSYSAKVIGSDADYDIAVIKVDPGEDKLQPVVLGTSSSLVVGDEVLAIGNPLGELTFSMSEGIVSCVNRTISLDNTPFNMIQITAAVNSGNSGGPLFNIYGEVVGIVSAKYSSSSSGNASVEGLGFAIPIDDVLGMIEDIIENGQVTSKAYLGVSVANASYYPQTGVRSGAYLAEVVENGPAARAGLQVGDVITMIGTTTITSRDDLTSAVGSKSYRAGDTATITFVRDGQLMTTELTFGSTTEKPAETQSESGIQDRQDMPRNDDSQGNYYEDYYKNMEEFFNQFFGGYGW